MAIVRAAYDAWKRRDVDALAEAFAEDAEVRPFLGSALGASTYRGQAGVRRWYADANDAWERLEVEPTDFHEAGERVVVTLRAVGTGRGSHAEVEAQIVHVIELREGKVLNLQGYDDRDAALRAAGVRE